MRIAFFTLGCKVNQYETQSLNELFFKSGYEIVQPNENADIYVINSCIVTAESERKTRQAVRKFKRLHPESIIVLTGCLPQAFPERAIDLPEADIILGNKNNSEMPELINKFFSCANRIINISEHKPGDKIPDAKISAFNERTRAILKIEDGCNRFCSYCIIPYSRGRVRSKTIEDIRSETAVLAQNGYKEIVLVGINLSAYGLNSEYNICDAVECVCSFDKIKRVRLGSLEPDHLSSDIISRLAKQDKLCAQFHISLQSGCDKTLKEMNRRYNTDEYRELCQRIRANFKNAAITTDIMVGFPGESDKDFEKSCSFMQEIAFERVHIFPYSARAGTKAAEFDGQVEKTVKEKRAHIMSEQAQKIRTEFLKNQIGKTMSVLVESKRGDFFEGYSENYTAVKIEDENLSVGEIVNVKITQSDDEYCTGVACV